MDNERENLNELEKTLRRRFYVNTVSVLTGVVCGTLAVNSPETYGWPLLAYIPVAFLTSLNIYPRDSEERRLTNILVEEGRA